MGGSATGLRYKRLLLKLSGEALMGRAGYGIDVDVVMRLCRDMKEAIEAGAELAVVFGGLPVPPRAWIAPRPTTWACWRRS